MLSITSAFDTVTRLQELIANLRYLESLNEKACVAIKDIGFVTPLTITPVAAMINKKSLEHDYTGPNISYLQTIYFPEGLRELDRIIAEKTYLPIIHLLLAGVAKDEVTRKLGALHSKYLELIKLHIVADPRFLELLTNNTFGFLLGELFDNIEEHSLASNVYVFAQYWPKSNACEVCIIDDGIGLFGSLQKAGRDVTGHLDALRKILETGLSAKNEFGDIRRGTGLKHTRAAITNREINGEFLILSGDAAFLHSATHGQKFFQLTDYKWNGTILTMRLNRPFAAFNLYDYVK